LSFLGQGEREREI